MANAWDERKKGLEEEYFHRKEQEALEKTRQRLAAEARERGCFEVLPLSMRSRHTYDASPCGGFPFLDKESPVMSGDYLSKVDTLRGELDQFRTVSRSMADITVIKVALSQLRRTLGSVEVDGDGPAVVPDDPERRWGWLLLVSLVEVSQREIEKCERCYGLNS